MRLGPNRSLLKFEYLSICAISFLYIKMRKTYRLISWKFYGIMWVHISLRFLLKFLSFYMLLGGEFPPKFISNSFEVPRELSWKLSRNSMEILWKFHGNCTEVIWKFSRNGIEVLLHWYYNYMYTILTFDGNGYITLEQCPAEFYKTLIPYAVENSISFRWH